MHLTLWDIVVVCHQNDGSKDSIDMVYVSGYCSLSESEFYAFGILCLVGLLVVCECSSVLLQFIVMSYVDCGGDG